MTQHLDHGSIPTFVERNPARHNQTIRTAASYRLLADPIEFSQNMAREIELGVLADLLMEDTPKQIDELRDRFQGLVEAAIERKDVPAIEGAFVGYHEFVTYALCDAREYGVALGAVMEQLRVGLTAVVDLWNRGTTFADAQSRDDVIRIRRKYGLPFVPDWSDTDMAKADEARSDG